MRADPAGTTAERAVAGEIAERVRALVPLLLEQAPRGDGERRVTQEALEALDAAGAFDVAVPERWGGHDLGARAQLEILRTIATGCASSAWLVWASSGFQAWIPRFGEEAMEEVFAPPWTGPRVAASGSRKGIARRTRDGWILKSGPLPYASGVLHASHVLCAMSFEDAAGNSQSAWALLPTSEVEILDDWHVSGMRGSNSNSVVVHEGTLVPDDRFLPFGEMAAGGRSAVRMRASAAGGWATMAAIAIGLVDGALELFLERAGGRGIPLTSYSRQLDAPQTHRLLAEVYMKTEGHRLIAERNAVAIDERFAAGEFVLFGSPTRALRDRLDAAHAVRDCCDALELLYRSSGTSAIRLDDPIDRAVRDCRVIAMQGSCKLEPLMEEYGRTIRPRGGADPARDASP